MTSDRTGAASRRPLPPHPTAPWAPWRLLAWGLALCGLLTALLTIGVGRAADRPGFADLAGDRPVLAIFAPGDGPDVHLQMAKLCHREEALAERDLALFLVAGKSVWALAHQDLAATAVPAGADRLRGDYGVEAEAFEVLLLDRYGTVMMRADRPVEAEAVFRRLDRGDQRPALAYAGDAGRSISTCAIPSSS
ncbi:hypothetical protein CCR85_11120 [Rhodothalassium salexigens]|nr:hypothetical protein [Rhodothalassium salexigens]MBK5921203.1 hypothetical protein [Rhodothalassium salexigens]